MEVFSKSGLLKREDMFFWSDVQLLSSSKENIKGEITTIYENYFLTSQLSISKEVQNKVKERYELGDYSSNIFEEASEEVFSTAVSLGLRERLQLFANAIIYKKRISNTASDLPDKLFEETLDLPKHLNWKLIYSKKGISLSKCKYGNGEGNGILETAIIHCPIEVAYQMIWDVNRRVEWLDYTVENRIVETLSSTTEIIYLKITMIGLSNDFCLLQTKKKTEDGSVVILSCSVDHPSAPIYSDVRRAFVDFTSYAIHRIDDSKCEVTSTYLVSLKEMSNFRKAVCSSEFILSHFGKRLGKLRKILEKPVKGKKVNTTQQTLVAEEKPQ